MSFTCGICHRPIRRKHAKPDRIILETRSKVYPERRNRKGDKVIDKGGKGWEIAKEVDACRRCVADRKKAQAQQ